MAKKGKRKASVPYWSEQLDAKRVAEAFAEATVDAYDESDRHAGLFAAVQDELQFPFRATVMG